MKDRLQFLGTVKLTQLQPNGLIIKSQSGYFYDHTRRLPASQLTISPLGVETVTPEGQRVLDIHHIDHPDKAYGNDDLVCIGFTSHYAAMRAQFGEHLKDGTVGENLIIECKDEIWPEQLGKRVAFENLKSGTHAYLDVVRFAAPCEEFSYFAANRQDKRLPAKELKEALQFLGNGRRGFLLVLAQGQETFTVQQGDRVFQVI